MFHVRLRLSPVGRLLALLAAMLLFLLLIPAPAFADGPPASTGSVVSSTALWGIVVGIITPPLVAVVQQPGWSERTRALVAAGVALAFGAITCWVDGSIGHGQTLVPTMGAVLIASQASYREFWSRVHVTQKIESATSKSQPTKRKPKAQVEGGEGDDQSDAPPAAQRAGTRGRPPRPRRGG